jgi:leucyl aminopeptidase
VGAGPKKELDDAAVRVVAALAARAAQSDRAASMVLAWPEKLTPQRLRAVGEGVVLGAYRYSRYLTGERRPSVELDSVQVLSPGRAGSAEQNALELGAQLGACVCRARDAVNQPPNDLTPAVLADEMVAVAEAGGLECRVLGPAEMAAEGMKLHLAVGAGSANTPRFIHAVYRPKRPKKRIAFVGKGLTFDSGGLCIKPAAGMGEMKSDMGGAAAVLGLMAALSRVAPPVEVHGIIGAAENMPDGAAYRPGDVWGSLDGKTVEIVNTDAEGRLVLADALTYAARLEPDLIVDAATLTGACVVALGKTCTGYYATSDDLAAQLQAAAVEAGERVWRMPLLEDLREQLKSDVADLKHTGERWGGSITAALFLREFTNGLPWIHCDIAGPAFSDRASGCVPKGGTGHGVMTFLRFVEALGQP